MPTEPPPASAPASRATGTRERLIAAMTDALRTRGLHGVGLNELLQTAGAPKGVLYHHFPGGKTELAIAAIDAVVDRMAEGLDRLLASQPDPLVATRAWLAGATRRLSDSGFESGCPLATVSLESTADDAALRAALARAFTRLRERIAAALLASGVPAPRASGLAALIVAAYEGGLLQARVAQSTEPLDAVTGTLLALLGDPSHRPTPPPPGGPT